MAELHLIFCKNSINQYSIHGRGGKKPGPLFGGPGFQRGLVVATLMLCEYHSGKGSHAGQQHSGHSHQLMFIARRGYIVGILGITHGTHAVLEVVSGGGDGLALLHHSLAYRTHLSSAQAKVGWP